MSVSARFEEKTMSREGNCSIHSTLEAGKQEKRKVEGCMWKKTMTSTGKDVYAYWLPPAPMAQAPAPRSSPPPIINKGPETDINIHCAIQYIVTITTHMLQTATVTQYIYILLHNLVYNIVSSQWDWR